MRTTTLAAIVTSVAALSPAPAVQRDGTGARGIRLETVAWPEAERLLTPEAVVVLPLGAASKEHGPHLRLRNDLTLAEYLARRVADATPVVVAPAVTYHYYPAFLEYPGSTSLSLNTARDLAVDIVRSVARHGPRRFYVLNTGISTARALDAAAEVLSAEGLLIRYTDFDARLDQVARGVREQQGGSHADEVETSMMLYIDPAAVDMSRAVRDYAPRSTPFVLTRRAEGRGTYSPSGIWGDPTLATADKGRIIVESIVAALLDDIDALRVAELPTVAPRTVETPPTAGTEAPARPDPPRQLPEKCSLGDDRAIRLIADKFATFWANADAERLGALWSVLGDIAHPDGLVERGSRYITHNRNELFSRREFRGSKHPMQMGSVRCLSNDIAVADGKWGLRGVFGSDGQPLPQMDGFFTLVVKRHEGTWLIEAYRYTMTPPSRPVPPAFMKRPGWPGGLTRDKG
ncbi:MAG TPA: creatininase family protein [Vicinamibacterales bacterium]|nr:creatininase family protein [Vicinamibacterales bacterium]